MVAFYHVVHYENLLRRPRRPYVNILIVKVNNLILILSSICVRHSIFLILVLHNDGNRLFFFYTLVHDYFYNHWVKLSLKFEF